MIAVSVVHVDAGERLVEQDDAAALRERPGEKHALPLSAGKLADLPLAKFQHADARRGSPPRSVDPPRAGCA